MKLKLEKPTYPKCGSPMRLLSTGYSLETYNCRICKTNMQVEKTVHKKGRGKGEQS